MKRPFAEILKENLDAVLNKPPVNDDDKLHYAVLTEINDRLYKKLHRFQSDYTLSFTPAQALALRIFYNDYINDPGTYLGNKLHILALEVYTKFH